MSGRIQQLFLLAVLLMQSGFAVAAQYNFKPHPDALIAQQSSVYQIAVDDDGFIWLSSDSDGLLRYDGRQAIAWLHNRANPENRQNINNVAFDPQGGLWMASWGGGLLYQASASATVKQWLAEPTSPSGLADNKVQTLYMDQQHRLWLGTIAGVNLLDLKQPDQMQRIAFDQPDHPLHHNRIWGITESADFYWFATSDGVVRLSKDLSHADRFILTHKQTGLLARANEVRGIRLSAGEIWANSSYGLYKFNQQTNQFDIIPRPDELSHSRLNVLLPNEKQQLWIGAVDGLYLYDPTHQQFVKTPDQQYNFLPDVDARSLALTPDQQLWIGTREQGVLTGAVNPLLFSPLVDQMPAPLQLQGGRKIMSSYFNPQTGLWLGGQYGLLHQDLPGNWHYIDLAADFGIAKITRILADQQGTLWLATDKGLLRQQDQYFVADNTPFQQAKIPVSGLTDLAISPQGDLLLAVWQRGILRWNRTTQHTQLELTEIERTPGDQIYQISQGPAGELYAATRYSGLFQQADGSNNWHSVPLKAPAIPEGFLCAEPDKQGGLWLCSEYGLWHWRPDQQQPDHYLPQHGLPGSYITGVVLDPHTGLWVSTSRGMAHWSEQFSRFVSYGVKDGLPSLVLSKNANSTNQAGQLVFATANGAVQLNPAALAEQNLRQPQVKLTQALVNEQPVDLLGQHLTLPYRYGELQLSVAVMDFYQPEYNRIRSRLTGLSSHWSQFSYVADLNYTNLAPGLYQLDVEGMSSRGLPSAAPLTLTIEVLAPWWAQRWFWLVSALLTLLLLFGLVKWRENRLRQQNSRLHQLVKARTERLEQLTTQLQLKAETDALTGLYNRTGFSERFQTMLATARRRQAALSLVMLDIDFFKQLNDQHGHEAGDLVLQQFAERLNLRLRQTDLLGRWGGEEFILALPDTDQTTAVQLCQTLLDSLQQPFHYQQQELRISATFGVASLAADQADLQRLCQLADQALYQGKNNGRACVFAAH